MRFSRLFAVAGIALLLSACASLTGPSAKLSLQQTHWTLSWLAGQPVAAQSSRQRPDLQFNADKQRVFGTTGCNRFMGSYTLKGQQLSLGELATTMMACARGMRTEQAYLDALAAVTTWKMHGDTLEFFGANKQPLARFKPAAH